MMSLDNTEYEYILTRAIVQNTQLLYQPISTNESPLRSTTRTSSTY